VSEDLIPSSSGRLSRRAREQRAYRLVLAGGTAGVVAVVGFVLAVVGVVGYSVPIIALIVAAVCVLLFRRTVSR
jgi:hypothetical protein